MANETPKRKLAAILSADVAGYGRLMQDDEAATVATLREYRTAIGRVVERHGGRIVNAPGDNVLAEFPSAVEAVQGACEIQQVLKGRNLELRPERRMEFRIGVNLGDVIEEADGTIYGDGVNIAARMEALAEAGGICISNTVYESVESKLAFGFDFLGEQAVKNVAKPVRVYRVRSEAREAQAVPTARSRRKPAIIAAAAIAVAVVAGGVIWALYARAPQEPAEVAEAPLPGKASVAVLPFANLRADAEHAFFADGLHETIISTLSNARRLFVPARFATLKYKEHPADTAAVAQELGVRHLLEGSVQVSGERVRVTMQLIDAATGGHIWAERYDRLLADIFALQDEITLEVVNALQVQLTEGAQALRWRGGTRNVEAWAKWQKGVALYRKFSKSANERARELFAEAVAIDPGFALGWAYLGWATEMPYRFGWSDDLSQLTAARELADKALALQDTLAVAHDLRAMIHHDRGEHDAAVAAARKAVEVDPTGSLAHALYADMLLAIGDFDAALAELDEAVRLSPVHPHWYRQSRGHALLLAGRAEQAAALLEQYVALVPDDPEGKQMLPIAYAKAGRAADARAVIARLTDDDPGYSIETVRTYGERAWAYKDPAVLESHLDALRDLGVPELPPPALPDKPSIAVLPFDNLSGDAEQEYFVDGLTEDIITALSRNRALFVIARNSTFQYKGEAVDPIALGRALGVRYLVEGSVRRAQSQIRVSAQLIDAATGGHVWAETYDRELSDIFAVQDELTREITVRAGVAVAEAGREGSRSKAPAELTAYDLVLRAVESDRMPTAENFVHDIELLEKAVALAPDYARAHARLAYTVLYEHESGLSDDPDIVERAGEHARRAVALDPADSRAHLALAWFYYFTGQKTLLEKEAAKSIELNPNDAFVLADLGFRLQVAFGMDRLAEGADMARRAMRLNPHHEQWYPWPILREHYFTGRYREALAVLEGMGYEEDYIWDHVFRAMIHGQLGNAEEARRARDMALALKPDYTLAWHFDVHNIHESYREAYIEGARKAGLPLGDLEALAPVAR